RRAIAFFASHLSHSAAIELDGGLVATTRQTIIGVRGIQNSTDTIYRHILDEANPKYPSLSLTSLLGDAAQTASMGSATSRGLFNATATLPGVFTRAAWDERISKAIDEAADQRDMSTDWVLSDAKSTTAARSALKAELRERYFHDYARAWETF